MSRNVRSGVGRPRVDFGGGSMRGYDGPPGGGVGYAPLGVGRGGPGLMDPGFRGRGGGGGEFNTLLHQRSLEQQLNLRESQLALANSLLQQQQQQQQFLMEGPGRGMGMGMMGAPGALGPAPGPLPPPMGMEPPHLLMNKRRMDGRHGDFGGPDFKRPRNDFSPRPRDRYRSRDNDEGNRSSSHSRRIQSSGQRKDSGKPRGSDRYDPEKPTADEEEEGGKGKKEDPFHCHVCNVNCRDSDGFKRHMNSMRHNDRMQGLLVLHEEKSSQLASRIKAEKHLRSVEDEDKVTRGFCKICDTALKVRFSEHQTLTFHRKRVNQVTKGCGWCGVSSFKNFTEVLAHRETEEHKKNQDKHGKEEGSKKAPGPRKRGPIRVEIPPDLARFKEGTKYGQMCVVPASGWFCKLCNKFYNDQTAAKDTHCQTEEHYVKYKRFVYTKLRAKAEAERAAEEKAQREAPPTSTDADENEQGEKPVKQEVKNEEEEDEENGMETKDDSYDKEEEDGEGGGEEEYMEEGGEGVVEEEEAMLAQEDGMAGEYLEEGAWEETSEQLLQDTVNMSDYHTADDTTGENTAADITGEGGEGVDLSLFAGESGSEFLNSATAGDTSENVVGEEEGEEEEEDEDGSQEEGQLQPSTAGAKTTGRATRSNVSTSTPVQNKARRGRKVAK